MVRIAVGSVEGDVSIAGPAVIVLDGTRAAEVHALDGEEPFTLWLGGQATVGQGVTLNGKPIDEDFVRRGVF